MVLESEASTRALLATQFWSLFNDHTLKQIILLSLLSRPAEISILGGDLQGVAIAVFAAPFLILAGPAGRTSDHHSRRTVIIWAKYAEIAIMACVGVAFFTTGPVPVWVMLGLLVAMASQSTFLMPAKYGIILDLVGRSRVSPTNGSMQMIGYAAIVAGTASGGALLAWQSTYPWLIGGCFVMVAVFGVVSAHSISPLRLNGTAAAGAAGAAPARAGEVWRSIHDCPLLRDAMMVYGFLWLIAGLYHPIINVFCRVQLQLSPPTTSLVLAASVTGIAAGCGFAGLAERRFSMIRWLPFTAIALVACQLALAVLIWMEVSLTIATTSGILFLLGFLTGAMVLPIHVLIQLQTPAAIRGRVLSVQSVVNWSAILMSGILYQLIRMSLQWWQAGVGTLFLALAVLSMMGVYFLRPGDSRLLR